MCDVTEADGGTGGAVPLSEAAPPELLVPDIQAETGEAHAAQHADLYEYARTLGVEPADNDDLLWVVEEAFNAPLPSSWAEFADESGRVYYFHDATSKTTWEHPMDEVFRELIGLVKRIRSDPTSASETQRLAIVRNHLQQVHQIALRELQVWSGPYASEQGDYYYNDELKASAWECPVIEWQSELTTRHTVLTRCLLSEVEFPAEPGSQDALGGSSGHSGRQDLMDSLKLPLGLVRRESHRGEVPDTPSTSRTFYTARSACSSRSRHSAKSDRAKRKEKKERKERDRLAEDAPAPPAPHHFEAVE
eukprot:TRINITY_DN9400_c0_g1_i5.p1 TRINITY_DN9400_c0_g1~~TRINITY_DN9400_c0_g1_i5.p1  ORF type:complete len:306 (+),score=55.54 TRINITY_DN9400_c0_g1_i5:96-1013(+)